LQGELSAADAARVKLFCTEMHARVVDRCLQLVGGYGCEVMKVIIAKSLGL
jgi:acyl-CoA dehydrogenase